MRSGWMHQAGENGSADPVRDELQARLRDVEQRMREMARHDPLTGLANRALFEEHLRLALARARRHDLGVAVLFVDLEGFGLLNDRLGRPIGDEVLRQAADRVAQATRETDLAARQDADEFLVLIADLERGVDGSDRAWRDAESVAGRIETAFADPFRVGGIEVPVRISMHTSVFPDDGRDAHALLARANAARSRSGARPDAAQVALER